MKKHLAILFFSVVCLCFSLQTFCYASKTSTGFYYPLDSFTYSTSGTWLGLGNGSAGPNGHIGVDMLAPVDTRVRAVADGTVYTVSYNGWDVDENTSDNVAVLIKHRLSDGRWFIALYGHIKKSTARKSGDIKAGDAVGFLGYYGGEPHLHLGIVAAGKDPIAPYGYSSNSNHNNFVDPISFINNYTPNNWLSVVYYPYFRSGNLAWFPGDVSCINADQWIYFNLGYPNGGMSIGDSNICHEHESEVYFNVDLSPYAFQILYGSGNINQYKVCQQ